MTHDTLPGVTVEENYVLARVTEAHSYSGSVRFWRGIAGLCERVGCLRILGISDREDPLSTMDAYDHVAIFEEAGITLAHRIACVEKHLSARQMAIFAETVLRNRGRLNGRVFSSRDRALEWLLQDLHETSPPSSPVSTSGSPGES